LHGCVRAICGCDDLDLAENDEINLSSLSALFQNVGERRKCAWAGVHAKVVEHVFREIAEKWQFLENLAYGHGSFTDMAHTKSTRCHCLCKTWTRRLSFLGSHKLFVGQVSCFAHLNIG